jgi:L-cysteine desulfidase
MDKIKKNRMQEDFKKLDANKNRWESINVKKIAKNYVKSEYNVENPKYAIVYNIKKSHSIVNYQRQEERWKTEYRTST